MTRVWRVSYEPWNRVLPKFVLILSFTFRFPFAILLSFRFLSSLNLIARSEIAFVEERLDSSSVVVGLRSFATKKTVS